MNAIIFDCETNGKPLNYKGLMSDVKNWPRVTQLAWQKASMETGEVLNQHESLIIPDGWIVPKEKFFIDNNMSTERCQDEGKPIHDVLDLLIKDMDDAELIVAHNLQFDHNVVGAEMIRLKKKSIKRLLKVCTMEASTNYLKMPGQYGKYKWPKLLELHKFLFGEEFDMAHDAMVDVDACRKSFFELIKRDVIQIIENEEVIYRF